MEKTKLTVGALLAASLAGNVFLLDKGEMHEVVVIDHTEPQDEVVGGAEVPLGAKLAEVPHGIYLCRRGVIDNLPKETVYCQDPKGNGAFVVPSGRAEDAFPDDEYIELEARDGKVFFRTKPKEQNATAVVK